MKKIFLLVVMGIVFLTGCTPTQQGAGTGALLGGAAGAIIGNQHSSARRDKGLLIGAAVGALAGTAIGQAQELKQSKNPEQVIAVCPSCDSRVDVTGLPAHSTVVCPNCKSKFTY